MDNLYYGKSVIYGISYLDISTSIRIVENIKIGTTIVQFDRGEYDLISADRPSGTQQRISLNLEHPFIRSLRTGLYGARQWKSGYSDNGYVSDVNTYEDPVTNSYLESYPFLTKKPISNTYFSIAFAGLTRNYGSSTLRNIGIYLRDKNEGDITNKEGYFIGLQAGTIEKFVISKFVGSSLVTELASASYGSTNYNKVKIHGWINNGNIYASLYGISESSLDQTGNMEYEVATGLSVRTSIMATDSDYINGNLGIAVFGNSYYKPFNGGELGDIIISEVVKPLSYQDILKRSTGYGDYLQKANFESSDYFVDKFSSLQSSGTWAYGITNGYDVYANLSVVSGSSYNWLIHKSETGRIFYRFETEMYGVSGVESGILLGSSSDFWALNLKIGSTNTSNTIYKTGSTFLTFNIGNPFLYVTPNVWNKLTVIRGDNELKFYVNESLASYIKMVENTSNGTYGLSVSLYTGVGYFNKQTGVSGGLLKYRNSNIQKLSIVSDDVEIPGGANSAELISRHLPTSYFTYVCGSTGVLITYAGTSRLELGLSNTYINENKIDSIEYRLTANILRGDDVFDVTKLGISRFLNYKARGSGIWYDYDTNINAMEDLDAINDNSIATEIMNINKVSLNVLPIPYIEKNDIINVLDDNSGMTISGVVDSFTTRINFNNGDYQQNINLNNKPSNLQ